jgi:hypothetical protein
MVELYCGLVAAFRNMCFWICSYMLEEPTLTLNYIELPFSLNNFLPVPKI